MDTFIEVGKSYLIRTVTYITIGRVVSINKNEIKLEEACWVAYTGRFYDCLKSGTLDEVEPFPDFAIVFMSAIVDMAPWIHDLPRMQQ